MKVFVFLLLVLPISILAQDVRVNVYDKFIKEQRVELEPLLLSSGTAGKVSINFSSVSATCFLEVIGSGWGASTIDKGNLVIFLFSNDTTVSLHATSLQSFEPGVTQSSYKHQYYISPAEVEIFCRYNLVGIRKYSFTDFTDLSIPRELVPRIKSFSNTFLGELKKANVLRTITHINVKNITTYIGDTVQLCSKIYNTRVYDKADGKPIFLDIRSALNEPFINIFIPGDDVKNFNGNPEQLYNNRDVCISGVVSMRNHIPQIIIHSHDQVVVKSPIEVADAWQFNGDSVTVAGKIVSTKYLPGLENGSTLLTIEDATANKLTIIIKNEDRKYFVDQPETIYLHKLVHVSGKLGVEKNRPVVYISNSNQLKIVDDNVAASVLEVVQPPRSGKN